MSEGKNKREFRRGLLDRNGCCDTDSPLMKSLINEEKRKLCLIRNICIGAWIIFMFILLAMAGVAALWFLAGMGPGPETTALLPLGLLATLALLGLMAAVATSLVFYFRSRTVSLSGIERRLAELERLLMSERNQENGTAG